MRPRLLRFVWLAPPAALLLLGVLFELRGCGPEPDTVGSLGEDLLLADPKLTRTLGTWAGPHRGLAPLGAQGLSIEMLLGEREWEDMRHQELVDGFRETERDTLLRFDGGPSIHASYRVRGGSSILSAFRHRHPGRLNFSIRLGCGRWASCTATSWRPSSSG